MYNEFVTGDGGTLEVTPNSSWPDIVYYNSFTHANMGWKIHIVDVYMKVNTSDAIMVGVTWLPIIVMVFFRLL